MKKYANQNIPLSSLTYNPKRETAWETLSQALCQLDQKKAVPVATRAEVLFDLLMQDMQPDHPLSVPADEAVRWFSQLHRFRDRIQAKIDEIEGLYRA